MTHKATEPAAILPEQPTTGETPLAALTAGESPAAAPPEAEVKPVVIRISGKILKGIGQAQTIEELRAAVAGLKPEENERLQGPIYEARRRIVAAGID